MQTIEIARRRSFTETLRVDQWWLAPGATAIGLIVFFGYLTFRAFNATYVYFDPYISPTVAPPVFTPASGYPGAVPVAHAWFGAFPAWWPPFLPQSPAFFMPALAIAFRLTCYYYRGAYYKAFFMQPPSCAVGGVPFGYRGERALLIFQNLHRYTLYGALLLLVFLWEEAIAAFFRNGQFGVGVGTIVMLEVSPRATRPLKDGVRVRVHYGSGNVPAHAALGIGKELAVGRQVVAQLRLESPVYLFAGDHLTIRDWSEQQTLAGAVVLDPDASRREFRTADRQHWLARVADALETPSSFIAALVARDTTVRPSRAFVKTRFRQDEIDAAIQQLVREGTVVALGDSLVDASTWTAARRRAAQRIDEAHREHPERVGLSVTDLRNAITKEFPIDDLFDALLVSLGDDGFARSGSVIQRASHRATLPEPLRAAGEAVRRALAAQPLEPPSRKELTPDAAAQRALKFLIESGEVVEIGAELVLSAAAAAQATTNVKAFLAKHGPSTVSELRQSLGSSRRVVVPFLEYLDRTFVTVRRGDKRALR